MELQSNNPFIQDQPVSTNPFAADVAAAHAPQSPSRNPFFAASAQPDAGAAPVQNSHPPELPPRSNRTSAPPPAFEDGRATQADQDLRTIEADVWYLKEISFEREGQSQNLKIITQNLNGPCSFIAICNILILRGDITIVPHDRETVSYELLSQLVANHLLKHSPDVDISSALTKMPLLTKGMDLNPLFTGVTRFRPAVDGGELDLFERAGIKLVHGWLVDPESPERLAVARVEDYDTAVNLIVEADHLTGGQLVGIRAGEAPRDHPELSAEDREKISHAYAVRSFIDQTKSQLTYHGLFTLASLIAPGSPVALFRNSHLSVLYKRPESSDDPALYSLVTDQVFLHEPSVVWERLEDVDQGAATFVDAEFRNSTPVGGDWAGYTAEGVASSADRQRYQDQELPEDLSDQELARHLQEQENAAARRAQRRYQQSAYQYQRLEDDGEAQRYARHQAKSEQVMKKKDCIIM